jgi:hypothetical protein
LYLLCFFWFIIAFFMRIGNSINHSIIFINLIFYVTCFNDFLPSQDNRI